MKITVKVHPKSKVERLEKTSETEFEAFFNVTPEKGKANQKLVEMLAEYFDVSKSEVVILSGEKAQKKIVEISY